MWKLDREDEYFRIYDSKKDIAGYFDPNYGRLYPKEKESELIEKMHKNHDKISDGYLMFPMVKFGIYDVENGFNISYLDAQLDSAKERISKWRKFLSEINKNDHLIGISHTDQDMLSISFPVKFKSPTPLEKKQILKEIEPILNLLQKQGLL